MSATLFRTSPYVGLVPYSQEDAAFFFGRERERQVIVGNLLASRLTLLYGPSGVGKSSVLRAGVLHDLEKLQRQRTSEDGRPEFVVVELDAWRDDPLTQLASRIERALQHAVAPHALPTVDASDALVDRMRRWTGEMEIDLLVILDQFEEFFLYDDGTDAPGSFADQLALATADSDLRVNFLLAIREDALARLDRFKGRIRNLFGNLLRIEHLDRDAARAAIERPVARYNELYRRNLPPVTVEPALTDAVLEQVRTGTVVLGGGGVGERASAGREHRVETPFLQLVLMKLWDEEQRRNPTAPSLRLSTLKELHNAPEIVRAHLGSVMMTLGSEEQAAAASAFQYLVTRSGSKIAYPVLDLAGEANLDEQLLSGVLEKLSARTVRILRHVGPAPGTPAEPRFERYEIFHDVLAPAVLAWRAEWVTARERREAEAESTRIAAEAARTEARDRELTFAREKAELERRSGSRARRMALLLGVAAAGAVLAAGLALRQTGEARRQAGLATSRELASASQQAVDPELRIILGVAAVESAPTIEAIDALQRAVQDSRLVRTLTGHRDMVIGTLFLPDGRVLTTGVDSTLRLWNGATGDSIAVQRLPIAATLLGFDAGRGHIAMMQVDDATARAGVLLWDLASARAVAASNLHASDIELPSFIDGRVNIVHHDSAFSTFAMATGGNVLIFDAASGQEHILEATDSVLGVDVSPDGTRVVLALGESGVEIRDARTGAPVVRLPSEYGGSMRSVVFTPEGQALVTFEAEPSDGFTGAHVMRVRDIETGAPIDSLIDVLPTAIALGARGHAAVGLRDSVLVTPGLGAGYWWGQPPANAHLIRFSPTGWEVLITTTEGEITAWDANTNERRFAQRGHTDEVYALSFDSTGGLFASAGADGRARIWQMDSNVAFTAGGSIQEIAVDASSGTLLVGLSYRGVTFFDRETGRAVTQRPDIFADEVAYRPGGAQYATSFDTEVILWETTTLQSVAMLSREGPQSYEAAAQAESGPGRQRVAWSPTGDRLAFLGAGGRVRVVQADAPSVQRPTALDTLNATALAWAPDGQRLAIVTRNGLVVMVDAATGAVLRQLVPDSSARRSSVVPTLAFDPAGNRLAVGLNEVVRIVDAGTGALLRELSLPQSAASLDWSPDGRLLASAGLDQTIRVWDPSSWAEQLRFTGRGAINVVRFDPDGSRLYAGGEDGIVRAFMLDTSELLARARSRISRPPTPQECERYRLPGLCART